MEQFRQIGMVLGSMRALMVFRDAILINQRQCCLLLDVFSAAYLSISDKIREHLRFNERHTKWRVLQHPLRDLLWTVRDCEAYIRTCLEPADWWAKAISLSHNRDCVELHIHNLLSCLPAVVEAIEMAGEISGLDKDEMHKKRLIHSVKYSNQWTDPQIFLWKYGKQYLVSSDFSDRFDIAWSEDRWILFNKLREKRQSSCSKKHDRRLADFLLRNLESGNENLNTELLPSSLLFESKDYRVRRRLGHGNGNGNGSQCREITWLGESFALRHFYGDTQALLPQISQLLSLSHPNIENTLCAFADHEKKECFLVMELMSRTLSTHIKEESDPKRKTKNNNNTVLFLPVAVDLMFQIARGMEYLHSKRIYHGELNPSNILVKPKGNSHWGDGHLHARISGFGLSSVKGIFSHKEGFPFIWYAPEVLEEQERTGTPETLKYTDKSDVYSFGMVCFELLTGKVPFEDSHLHGDKMSRNIRAGERPLFPLHSPKYITNLTKRCWHTDPNQRPSFSSICRILRYIKGFLSLNPKCYSSLQDPPASPLVDYCEIEAKLSRKLSWESTETPPVAQIPFQIFVYRVMEREKTCSTSDPRDSCDSGSDRASLTEDEALAAPEYKVSSTNERRFSNSNKLRTTKKRSSTPLLKRAGLKPIQEPGSPRGRTRAPPLTRCGRSMRIKSESQLMLTSLKLRGSRSGHLSDSELS